MILDLRCSKFAYQMLIHRHIVRLDRIMLTPQSDSTGSASIKRILIDRRLFVQFVSIDVSFELINANKF